MKNFKCRGCFGNSQAQSHEITFRYSRSNAETQELCEDRRWILCPFYLGKNYWFGELFVEQFTGHHETFEAQFIKLTIYGEMPMGPESHQDSWFWSNKQLFSDGYCERPCINSVEYLGGDFSINNAFNPINLGAKWKLLLSRFGKCPWVKDLTQYWLSYGLVKEQNLILQRAQNESVFLKFFCCFWLCSFNQIIK